MVICRTNGRLWVGLAAVLCLGGCSVGPSDGGGDLDRPLPQGVGIVPSEPGGSPAIAQPQGPTVEPGPSFAITATRLETSLISLRAGVSVPEEVVQLITSQRDSLDPALADQLDRAGLLGAMLSDKALADVQLALSKPVAIPLRAEGETAAAAPLLRDVSLLSIRPSAAWTMLAASSARGERWALAVPGGAVALEPGSLRLGVRVWPEPGLPLPNAGMEAHLRVQLLPVVVPMVEPPAPLQGGSTLELGLPASLRGQLLIQQQLSLSLAAGGDPQGTPSKKAAGTALVFMALPRKQQTSTSGPEVERPGMIGQTLLEGGPGSGPRILVLRAVVPGTYRLLLE